MMFRRFLPKTVAGQLIVILAFVLIFAQIINLALLVGSQRIQARSIAYQNAMEHAARVISDLPDELPTDLPFVLRHERGGARGTFFLSTSDRADDAIGVKSLPRYNARFQRILGDAGIKPLQTTVTFLPVAPPLPSELAHGDRLRRPALFGRREQRGPPPRGKPRGMKPAPDASDKPVLQEIRLSMKLKEDVWFNAFIPRPKTESLSARILLATTLLLSLSLLAAWIFARRIARPISEFTLAADKLGRGQPSGQLNARGPQDIRQAAIAFNTMQRRITKMLETQRTMLRAVGHDLRTPLTSLRLRAENIDDDKERNKVISTLNDMTLMTEEILSWAKDASGTEELASVDLGAMLQSIVDDYQDQGHDVDLLEFESLPINIRRVSIKRAIQNLIDNGLKYAGNARLSVEYKAKSIIIYVDDEGPGMSQDELAEVMKPFVRLETSRSKDTGGTGLGLSISETIVQIHGGTLLLSNRKPNGLRASINLPI